MTDAPLLYAEDLPVGSTVELGSHAVTLEEMLEFARQWDPQGFHTDPEVAAAGHFGEVIASGIHTLGIYQRLSVEGAVGRWAVIAGRRVVLVDDSIVRGTTSRTIVAMMREAGAAEVHFRIACPPIKYADYYGIDMPEQDKLIAWRMSVDEIRDYLGVDSLAFLSIDGLYRALGQPGRNAAMPQYTDHYFTGEYPTAIADLVGEASKQLGLLAEAG